MKYSELRKKPEERSDTLTASVAQRAAAMLDRDRDAVRESTPLPPLWHWFYFLDSTATLQLGSDGHPHIGTGSESRRVFGGTHVVVHSPLVIGEMAVRRTVSLELREKAGRSGPLVLVDREYEIESEGGLAVTERETIVYFRGPSRASGTASIHSPGPPGQLGRILVVDPLLLFRFSALTFNSHRIHYDLEYARNVEGYPDLVVQGPLLALLLAELARLDGSIPSKFTFRAHSPAFSRDTISLAGAPGNEAIDLVARTERGLAASARLALPDGARK